MTMPHKKSIQGLFQALGSTEARTKFGAARTLRTMSESRPEALYPYFDRLLELSSSDNSFLRWDAMRCLANLAKVDRENRIEANLDRYLSVIPGPQMIGAATVIEGAATIALAKPALADRLARAILGVRNATYKTDECRNVAIGHAVVSLSRFWHLIQDREPVMDFVRSQLDNTRPSTREKAERFLKHTQPV
jgi:hypothetical protein